MNTTNKTSASFSDSKPHYEVLDGLRGMAALMVICYHVFEGFATTPIDQRFNHGYLAVDFFFLLSGFVIGYAYDDRWGRSMNMRQFFRRRLIRLHPMVLMGTLLGAVTFMVQGSMMWDGTHVSPTMVLLAAVLGIFMLPAFPGTMAEVRGNGEMFPLDGPAWSLFFEYIGNILYALFIHRLSTRHLRWLVILTGAGLLLFGALNGSGYGHLGVGWTMADHNFLGGMLRMTFSYTMGMYLSRTYKPRRTRGAFWWCSLLLFVVMVVPHVGGEEHLWMNGLYDALVIIVCFPLVLLLGASGVTTDGFSTAASKFLGDLSYPLYIIHYPFFYLFYAWVWRNGVPFAEAWPVALITIAWCIALAYACLKLYDEPVRSYLSKRWK